MPKPAQQVRRENFSAEVERLGGKKAFIDRTDENPDMVNQILRGKENGGRNIGDRLARRLEAEVLKRPLYWLDQDHSKALEAKANATKDDQRSQSLFNNQVENDIDAVRHAISALYAFIASERPAEAARIAAAMRDQETGIPQKFLENDGFVKLLMKVLDKGARRARIAPPSPSA
jgi:hypothetical protein